MIVCNIWTQQGYDRIQTSTEEEAKWVQRVNRVVDGTLYTSCNPWYLGANIPGKPRVFMPLVGFPCMPKNVSK